MTYPIDSYASQPPLVLAASSVLNLLRQAAFSLFIVQILCSLGFIDKQHTRNAAGGVPTIPVCFHRYGKVAR